MKNFIASIDIGTTNIKINLFNLDFEVVDSLKYTHLNINNTDEIFEMDLVEIRGNVLDGLRKLIKNHQVDQLEVILTTAMHSVQLLKDDFTLKGSLIAWADKRGSKAIGSSSAKDKEDQYYRTGTPIHSMNPFYKLCDLKDKIGPHTRVGSLKDVLFYDLTGEWALDLGNASSSGLLNLKKLNWCEESLETVGIEEKQLPVIKGVSYNLEAISGLFEADVTVSIGTSDGISSNYVFSDLNNVAVLSIGTSHAVRVIASEPQLNFDYQNFSYAISKDKYLIGLPSNNGADVLLWATKVFNASFEELNEIAMMRPETSSIFIPYLNGERAPIWKEFATGKLFDLTRVSTRESVLFSIILGMIFNIKHNVSLLSDLVEFDAIGLVGGVTELKAFPQLIADVLGYKLYIPTMKNAETLGSIAVVKGIEFESEYEVVEPQGKGWFDEMFGEYVGKVDKG